jgi:hypothetical protein
MFKSAEIPYRISYTQTTPSPMVSENQLLYAGKFTILAKDTVQYHA